MLILGDPTEFTPIINNTYDYDDYDCEYLRLRYDNSYDNTPLIISKSLIADQGNHRGGQPGARRPEQPARAAAERGAFCVDAASAPARIKCVSVYSSTLTR